MNPKHEWFKLSKSATITLFIYYCINLIITIYLLLIRLSGIQLITDELIFESSLWVSIITSVLGATVFYIRKLYKACINADMVKPDSENDKLRQIGIFFYFFLRPIFSGIFSIIILIILKSGISILSTAKSLTIEFYYLSIITSFFIGFSSGDLIDKFEEVGKKIVTQISDIKV
jgi:phosphate/sulfate permease